jgi:phospholipid-binding lipoprotein MlaA
MSSAVRVGAMAIALALAGCATTNPKDPLEKFNRAMFSFNDAIDQAALKPAAEAYRTLPSFVQTGVSNFFGNLGDVWTAANNLMQGKMADGMSDVMRVTFNSTFGLFGVLDIASEAGLAKHKEDFGQTLGKWGVGSGPYVVLPLLGPSTLRDTVATPVDLAGDPWDYARPVRVRNLGYVGRVVDQRAAVLDASNLLEEAALDRYVFVRDAYMQRRESKVRDGDTPDTSYQEDDKAFMASRRQDLANPVRKDAAAPAAEPAAKAVVEAERNTVIGTKTISVEAEKKQ